MEGIKITGIKQITKQHRNRSQNGYNDYLMSMNDGSVDGKQIAFRSNYQFFYDEDDKELWGFDPFTHRRCYYESLYVWNTRTGERMYGLEDYLTDYLKRLDLEKNIHYLEKHEQEEMLESMKSEWQVYSVRHSLPSAQKSLPHSKY